MAKSFILGFLRGLKFPFKLLVKLFSRKRKKVKDKRKVDMNTLSEGLKEKQQKHVQNFDPTRLKNRSWQVRAGKKQKEYYQKRRKRRKTSNNFSKNRNY